MGSTKIKNYMGCIMLIWLFLATGVKAQPDCIITHYSSGNGLSQNTVMSILQDRNGLLWLGTWDGINRFNGYDFKVYKAEQNSDVEFINNRVDMMKVDPWNYIWVLAYDNLVYRFDQKTERFRKIPEKVSTPDAKFQDIQVLDNGTIWLLSDKGKGVRVLTNPGDFSLETSTFLLTAEGKDCEIRKVFSDNRRQEWLLTTNGLMKFVPGKKGPVRYFCRQHPRSVDVLQSFYSYCINGDDLYFGSDEGKVYTYHQKTNKFSLLDLPVEGRIIAINRLKDGRLLLSTSHDGLLLYDLKNNDFKVVNRSNAPEFPADDIVSTYMDSYGEIWFEMSRLGEVCHYNPSKNVFKRINLWIEEHNADRSYPMFHICEDVNRNLWVHPYGGGLSWYDRKNDRLVPFHDDPAAPDWRFSRELHSMFSDRQGNLWLCTHSGGLEKITFFNSMFHLYPQNINNHRDIAGNQVRTLFEDNEQHIWVGKRDGRIEQYTKEWKYLGYLTEGGTIAMSGTPLFGAAYGIIQDRKGHIWIATKGKGILKMERTGNRYHITRFEHRPSDVNSLSHNNVYSLCEDRFGRIWAATFGGGLNYISQNIRGDYEVVNINNRLKTFPLARCYRARDVKEDGKGNIWVATSGGALCFRDDFKVPEKIDFHLYSYQKDNVEGLSSNNVYQVLPTSKGLYLITFGGGLNRLKTMDDKGNATFESFTMKDGLPSNVLLSAQEDAEGNIWLGTENGLSKFIPFPRSFENYNERDFGRTLRLEEAASLRQRSGTLMFGTDCGILYFRPDEIRKSTYVPPIVFDNLKVSNQVVTPDAKDGLLEQSINTIKKLVLSHKENIITLYFSALDFINPENIQYAYILEGFDKEWNYVGRQHTATYTNLPKGKYVFRVKSTNSDGVWVKNERTLEIVMKPSFWETGWAYFLYFIIFLLLVAGTGYILFIIYRLRHKVSVEKEVTDIKLRFFTNVSHELRTPLTLITGPIEYVLLDTNLPQRIRKQLEVVKKNTDRMLRLVNQILDFRKIEKNKMQMRVEQINVISFLEHELEYFRTMAEEQHIHLVFDKPATSLLLWADSDKLEKIIFNLLSNAFKYTSPGKTITLFVKDEGHKIAIGVKDEGMGISDSKMAFLFVRFETSLGNIPVVNDRESSGVGLSVVKELVDMHHATIHVESKEGRGSCFTVEFFKGREHYPEGTEFILSDNMKKEADMPAPSVPASVVTEEPGNASSLLIVEDNEELRLFLKMIFEKDFQIIEAENGLVGLEKAIKYLPDIIISDIMMPVKDGIALTHELHETLATSHIPIVLLTAKTDMDSKLSGLKQGADAYITKPFSSTYLKVRVENLLKKRQELQRLYCSSLLDNANVKVPALSSEIPSLAISDYDRKFMEKLTALIENNISNGNLVIEDLATELAVSRSVFFRKLKSLTGLAPIEFIKEMRVKKAARLIVSTDDNMSQIAYMVGFNDSRYFSKCFKAHYGVTPTEYRSKMKK